MNSKEIVRRYFEGYTVKQIAQIIYDSNRNLKGIPTINKSEALEIVETAIIKELARLSKEETINAQ